MRVPPALRTQRADFLGVPRRMSKEEGRPEFTFYDGPPFATGMPHYGHILAGTIKVAADAFLVPCRPVVEGLAVTRLLVVQ